MIPFLEIKYKRLSQKHNTKKLGDPMEVESIIVESDKPEEVLLKLCIELENSGFADVHETTLKQACQSLEEIIGINFLKRKSFKKKVEENRPHLLINKKAKGAVILGEPVTEEYGFEEAFEVTCFSKSQIEILNLVKTLKEVLIQKVKVPKKSIHDGDFDENCGKKFIRSLSETPRSNLVKKVGHSILNIFTDQETKTTLRGLVSLPLKVFGKEMIGEIEPKSLVSSGIAKEYFSIVCKKCGPLPTPSLYDSIENVSSTLAKKALVCPHCGEQLNSENTIIESYFKFTKLGLECAKGLWLEAFVKSIIEELGIKGDKLKYSAVHGKDELDLIFADCNNLYVCECKDKVFGRNDAYIVGMKVNRINEDEKAGAEVDKVLVISTEPISKDVISSETEYVRYVPISGNPEEIRRNLQKTVRKFRGVYKRKRARDLRELSLDFLPSKVEELYPYFL